MLISCLPTYSAHPLDSKSTEGITIDTPSRTNIDTFSSDKSIDLYAERAYDDLYPHEATVIDTYFTDRTATILDLGCGTGRTVRHLLGKGFDVVGVDVSESMVHRGSDLFSKSHFVTATASDLPFQKREFKYVLFSFNGLDYLVPESERRRTLQEIHRVLKSEGVFIFSSHNPWYLLPTNPTSPGGWLHLFRFWIRNWKQNQLTDTYKNDPASFGILNTHYISPAAQRRQLREYGFETLTVKGRFGAGYRTWVDPWPYYVASK